MKFGICAEAALAGHFNPGDLVGHCLTLLNGLTISSPMISRTPDDLDDFMGAITDELGGLTAQEGA